MGYIDPRNDEDDEGEVEPLDVEENLEARCAPACERRSEIDVRREEVALLVGVEVAEGTSRPAQP